MARKLVVEIIGDASSLEAAFGKSSKAASSWQKGLRTASIAAAAAFGGIAIAAKIGFDEIAEGQKVAAQTGATLKSTGGIANVTAKEVANLATEQSKLTGIDDELVQAGENLILTFKNVRNEVGRGNDIFNRATEAALDLSTAGFGSVESASKTLGKALNDPIKGMTALSRAGVTFSAAQKETIKRLVETGRSLDAQKLILKEVESQVGGSAKAYGETLPGQLAKTKNAFEETTGQLTLSLLPALTRGAQILQSFTAFTSEHATATKAVVAAIAGLAGTILAVNVALKVYAAFQAIAAAATGVWTAAQWLLNAALTANPIGIVVVALGALVAGLVLAYTHSEKFRAIVAAALNAVRVAAEAVLGFFRSNWKTIAVLISGPFIPLVALATDAFGIRSKLIAAFTAIKDWVGKNWPEIVTLISGPFAPIVALATDAFGIRSAMVKAFVVIKEAVIGTVDAIVSKFKWLRDNSGKIFEGFYKAISPPIELAIALFERLDDIIETVRRAVLNVIDQIANIKVPSLPGLPGLPGIPGRQHGGPVRAGSPYVVGEAGPELFIPGTSGHIAVASRGVGGAGGTYVFNFPNYVGNERELAESVRREFSRIATRNPGALPGVA